MGKATYLGQQTRYSSTGQALYRLDPPLKGERWSNADDGYVAVLYEHVLVSARSGETYIFGCDADGKVDCWLELDGSFRGGHDHERALQGAGYEIVRPDTGTEGE